MAHGASSCKSSSSLGRISSSRSPSDDMKKVKKQTKKQANNQTNMLKNSNNNKTNNTSTTKSKTKQDSFSTLGRFGDPWPEELVGAASRSLDEKVAGRSYLQAVTSWDRTSALVHIVIYV